MTAAVGVGVRVHQLQVVRLRLRRVHWEMYLLEAAEGVSRAWDVGVI